MAGFVLGAGGSNRLIHSPLRGHSLKEETDCLIIQMPRGFGEDLLEDMS